MDQPARADRVLRYATAVFAACFLLHNADHLRRGVDVVTPEVLGAGTVAGVLAAIAVTLVFLRHRQAPLVAAAVGFPTAFGVIAAHLLPHWSAFSDALPGGHVDAFTWAAVIAEVGGAFALGAAGLNALRADADAGALSPAARSAAPGSR
jgi:hypothetical protein